MDRRSAAWIWMLLPVVGAGVAESAADPLTHLEGMAGRLVFYQLEGNATCVRDAGELASEVPTETTFELFDPQKNFSMAEFTYTWDLGNGQVIRGAEPVVRYHYSASGNYTLRLQVGVSMTEYSPAIPEYYSKDVQVLDAIKSIELKGPSDYEVSQNTRLAFDVDGSPPMWVCWRFVTNCVADVAASCTLTVLHGNTLRLNHTFTAAGVHCLHISARNDISRMQTSFSLHVRRSNNTHLIFILSCAAILLATFSFIAVIACRPRPHDGSQSSALLDGVRTLMKGPGDYSLSPQGVAPRSNAIFLKNQDAEGQSAIVLNFSAASEGEKEPLLTQRGTPHCS